jgi:hypothetical protein
MRTRQARGLEVRQSRLWSRRVQNPGWPPLGGALVTIVIETPADVSATMDQIGATNESLGCLRGSGVGGEGMTAT